VLIRLSECVVEMLLIEMMFELMLNKRGFERKCYRRLIVVQHAAESSARVQLNRSSGQLRRAGCIGGFMMACVHLAVWSCLIEPAMHRGYRHANLLARGPSTASQALTVAVYRISSLAASQVPIGNPQHTSRCDQALLILEHLPR